MRRVRKASSDFINKVPPRGNRRSWHESQSQFTIGGGSGESAGNDSDNSVEEPPPPRPASESIKREGGSLHGIKPRDEIALRRSHRDLNQHRFV